MKLAGHTIWGATKGVWGLLDERNVALTAAGVAFYALFAIFPAVGAVIALWSLWQDPIVIQQEMEIFREVLPPSAFEVVLAQVKGIISASAPTLSWALVASLLISLWSAMWAVDSLMRGLNAIYRRPNPHSLLAMLISVLLAITLIFMALIALVIVVIAPIFLTFLPLGPFEGAAIGFTHIAVAVVVAVVGIWLLYRFGPNRNGYQVGRLIPGVVIAMLLWAVASLGFTYFITNFGRYNEVYGSLAAAAALLMWLYLSAYALLLGAAFNAEIDILEAGESQRVESSA